MPSSSRHPVPDTGPTVNAASNVKSPASDHTPIVNAARECTHLAPAHRLPLLVLGFVALVTGTSAGLARLGWPLPDAATAIAALHGPLMICGFFGTVIALERAVALRRLWAYAAPLGAGLGTLALLGGLQRAAPWFYVAGGAVLAAASIDILRRQRELFTVTLTLGALAWLAGSARWALGFTVHEVVPWWLAFLVLTIAGERLELSRFLPPSPTARRVFVGLLVASIAGLAGGTHGMRWGGPLFALALLGLALWLARQDIARRTVRGHGLTRYIAVALLAGYFWLGVAGAVALANGGFQPGGAGHDAALHALLIGFVFSMVFGHAPIILPAVLHVKLPYHPSFYAPLALLHASLALRLCGDASGSFDLRRLGGLLNALALLAFIANSAFAVWRGRGSAASPKPDGH